MLFSKEFGCQRVFLLTVLFLILLWNILFIFGNVLGVFLFGFVGGV
jgi:hypothetical protein